MRGDAEFCVSVHLECSNLNFDSLALGSDNGRVQRLVVVFLGIGDVIVKFARYIRPQIVHDTEDRVAVADIPDQDALIAELEAEKLKTDWPAFGPGDTVVVQVRVKEGERERLQAFEGVVIAKRNRGINSAFTVRKISNGEGVERAGVGPLHAADHR